MLNAKEAAQITIDSQGNIDQRAELIWNNKIEEDIRQTAARGETQYCFVPDGYEDKYMKSLGKIAKSLGYDVTDRDYMLFISWKNNVSSLQETK